MLDWLLHILIFLLFSPYLNSKEFSQKVSVDGKITYTYGPNNKKFVVGVDNHKNKSKEMSDEKKQDIVKWMLAINGLTISEGQTLIQYLRVRNNDVSLKDIPRMFYSLGFRNKRVKLGEENAYFDYLVCYSVECRFDDDGSDDHDPVAFFQDE